MIGSSHSKLGLGIIMISGILTASFPLPIKYSRKWHWENTWFVYATFALVIIPIALAIWAVPDLFSFYMSIPRRSLMLPLLFGFGWGIAQATFWPSIERVGMAMTFAIVVGLSSLLGSVVPLAVFHPRSLIGRPGAVVLISGCLLVGGLVFYSLAGWERDLNARISGPRGSIFFSGLLLCIFTGCFGSMINIGFVFGGGIAEEAVRRGISPERATLCVWAVVLAAGYLPNLAYTLYLLRKKSSASYFQRSLVREALLAIAAAALWLFGMLGYGVGASLMGTYGNSIGFAVCMAVLLLWSSMLGVFAGEWRVASHRARSRMCLGVILIIASMSVLGIGS